LWNVQYTCPALKFAIINTYRCASRIFVNGNDKCVEFLSQEGTTQGCPLAMAMYAIALTPLLKNAKELARQVWFADDATGCDQATALRKWYDLLVNQGPNYGYFPQPEKCILIVKEGREETVKEAFQGTAVKITSVGARHLGAVLGTAAFKEEYIQEKVSGWIKAMQVLSKFAKTQPHAAFATFTHCLQACWTFLCRTIPGAGIFLRPLEDCIRNEFLPSHQT